MSVKRGERDENGNMPSYYTSADSNQRAMRPGQPVGRQVAYLQTNPTREWVRRNAPTAMGDSDKDAFFTGTNILRSVGKDEGLSGVRCMAVVNDRVWIGEREGCFSIWDHNTGDRVFRSTKKKDIFVWSVIGPVNSNFVWVGYSDSFIRVFDSNTMELVKEMKEHVGGVYALADTPGGRVVYSGSSDFTIVKWDGFRMERIGTMTGHKNNVRALLVVGKRLFSGSDDHTIRVWDVQTNEHIGSLLDHTKGVHALAFSSGKHLWSASEDKTIRVWNPDADQPVVKVLKQPHNGQINCLSLTGSLMWSSSWNVTYVWDPETFECKAQYKHHEGCINALLPVHQSVVSRVWSASNDGVINLWDTECTYRAAVNASSDGRLEDLQLQLDEAMALIEKEKKGKKDLEKICVDLRTDKDRTQLLLDSQKSKYEQQAKEQRRQQQESAKRNQELKERLEGMGEVPQGVTPVFDTQELLDAYQLGLDPNSTLPADYEDDDFLDDAERQRREKLRDAFAKGRANCGVQGDETETRLRRALDKAYRAGDLGSANIIRDFLDERFPSWRRNVGLPVLSVPFRDDCGDLDEPQRTKLRETFLAGFVSADVDKVPNKKGETQEDADHFDAFMKGFDTARIFPDDVDDDAKREAFARGLGSMGSEGVPPEYSVAGSRLSPAEVAERRPLREAFLRGRYAAQKIPVSFDDDAALATKERERLRVLREHFLHGLKAGPQAELPQEYKPAVSDLTPSAMQRRDEARDAFQLGQKTAPLIPEGYTRREEGEEILSPTMKDDLLNAFLDGYAHDQMPSETALDASKQKRDAYKEGWLAGCPFKAYLEAPPPAVTVVHQPPETFDNIEEELEALRLQNGDMQQRIAELEAENERLAASAAAGSPAPAEDDAGSDDRLARALEDLAELRRLLEDSERDNEELRRQLAAAGQEPRTVTPARSFSSRHGDSKSPEQQELIGTPTSAVRSPASAVRSPGSAALQPADAEVATEELRPFHKDRVTVGGVLYKTIPPLGELEADDEHRLRRMQEEYAYELERGDEAGDVNLPRLSAMSDADQDFIKGLMALGARSLTPQQSPEKVRQAVDDVAEQLPEPVHEKLIQACDEADRRAAERLEEALRRAGERSDVPNGHRGEIEGLLSAKDRLSDSEFAAALRQQAFDMIHDKEVPRDVRNDLRRVMGEEEEEADRLEAQLKGVMQDTSLPLATRLALGAHQYKRTDHVSNTMRELLEEGGLPGDVEDEFRRVLAESDTRDTELRNALRVGKVPGDVRQLANNEDTDIDVLAGEAQRRLADADTDPGHRQELHRIYDAFEGRRAAVDDSGRAQATNETLSRDARRRLRQALLDSGVPQYELVADAVRYALADEGTPDGVKRTLQHSLTDLNSRQGDLCAAVREFTSGGWGGEDLESALEGCESRAQLVAAILGALAKRSDAEVVAKPVKAVVANSRASHTGVEETAATLALHDEVPRRVQDQLMHAAAANEAALDAAAEAARQLYADGEDGESALTADTDPSTVVQLMREELLEADMDYSDRQSVNSAINTSDKKFALLRTMLRKLAGDSSLPDEVRKQARAAADCSDAAASTSAVEVRALTADASIPPSVRQELHTATLLAQERFENLYDLASAGALNEENPENQRTELADAVAEAKGKPQLLINDARDASRNKAVPPHVRRRLREALGDQEALETQEAVTALAQEDLSNTGRQELTEALRENRDAASDLKDAVKDILEHCDLSQSLQADLTEALKPVEGDEIFGLDQGVADASDDSQPSGPKNPREVSELVRTALQEAGISTLGRLNSGQLQEALKKNQEHQARLEDAVREAIDRGSLPESAQQRLEDALKTKETRAKRLRLVTLKQGRDSLVDEAERMLRDEPLSEARKREILFALESFNRREAILQDEMRALSAGLEGEEREALVQCESAQELDDLLDKQKLGSDSTAAVRDALHRYNGKREVLQEALRQLSPLQQASAEPTPQALALEPRELPPAEADAVARVADDLDALGREAENQRTAEDDANQELIQRLGGQDAAARLAEQLDTVRRLESERLRKQQELEDLRRLCEAARTAQPVGKAEAEAEAEAGEEDPEKAEALRKAYSEGRAATEKTPLPPSYRSQLSEDDEDAVYRTELTDAWLRGRQEALGSIVPSEYAEVEGLAEEESAEREAKRNAFLDGLAGREVTTQPIDSEAAREALERGREQRESELRRAGASEEDKSSRVFTHGVEGGKVEEAIRHDASDEEAKKEGKLYGRGRWLRQDVKGEGHEGRDEQLDLLSADKTRIAQLVDELNEWRDACNPAMVRSLGLPVASPTYVNALQKALHYANQDLDSAKQKLADEQELLRQKERQMAEDHQRAMQEVEQTREREVGKLQDLLNQMEHDLSQKGTVHNSLNNRIETLTEQLGKSSAENEALTQELIKKASVGDVTELVTYYKERERKWHELSHLNRELQAENKTLITESTALVRKLRALSFVFESRPTLLRSLFELHKQLSRIPQTLHGFSKRAGQRALPRLEILNEIREVGSEVDTCKEGTRWIISHLFTAYELQHLGTSPQFFVPDGRRPTWRDIQFPVKQREWLLQVNQDDGGDPMYHSSSPPQGQKRRPAPRSGSRSRNRV